MKCDCGFQFAGPGQFRNCQAFVWGGQSGVICPKCGEHYVGHWKLTAKEMAAYNKFKQTQ